MLGGSVIEAEIDIIRSCPLCKFESVTTVLVEAPNNDSIQDYCADIRTKCKTLPCSNCQSEVDKEATKFYDIKRRM